MDDNARCKNCRSWGLGKKDREPAMAPYHTPGPPLNYPQRACGKVVDASAWEARQVIELPTDVAFIDLSDSYDNDLMTGPDFGCIHFEEQTPAR